MITTSRPLDLGMLTRPGVDYGRHIDRVVVRLHHRGSRYPIFELTGPELLIVSVVGGMQRRIEMLKGRGMAPSRIAYKIRRSSAPAEHGLTIKICPQRRNMRSATHNS